MTTHQDPVERVAEARPLTASEVEGIRDALALADVSRDVEARLLDAIEAYNDRAIEAAHPEGLREAAALVVRLDADTRMDDDEWSDDPEWRAALDALAAVLSATPTPEAPERRSGVERRHGPGSDLPNLHERRSAYRREGDWQAYLDRSRGGPR